MKKVFIVFAIFAVIVTLTLSYVIFTESGLRLLVTSLEKVTMGKFQVGEVEGKLTEKIFF